jgi:hypothetical protein
MKRRDLIKELLDGDMDDECYAIGFDDSGKTKLNFIIDGLEPDEKCYKKRGIPQLTLQLSGVY